MSFEGRELDWNDEIEKESPDFVVLPEGDYDFEIIKFERGRHPGSDRLPPCNKAVVHIRIEGEEGVSIIHHNLFLHTITEGLLTNFFTGIGQRRPGERVRMNWNAVVGAKGRAQIGIRTFTNRDGEERTFNEIKKFYEPEDAPQQPAYQTGTF